MPGVRFRVSAPQGVGPRRPSGFSEAGALLKLAGGVYDAYREDQSRKLEERAREEEIQEVRDYQDDRARDLGMDEQELEEFQTVGNVQLRSQMLRDFEEQRLARQTMVGLERDLAGLAQSPHGAEFAKQVQKRVQEDGPGAVTTDLLRAVVDRTEKVEKWEAAEASGMQLLQQWGQSLAQPGLLGPGAEEEMGPDFSKALGVYSALERQLAAQQSGMLSDEAMLDQGDLKRMQDAFARAMVPREVLDGIKREAYQAALTQIWGREMAPFKRGIGEMDEWKDVLSRRQAYADSRNVPELVYEPGAEEAGQEVREQGGVAQQSGAAARAQGAREEPAGAPAEKAGPVGEQRAEVNKIFEKQQARQKQYQSSPIQPSWTRRGQGGLTNREREKVLELLTVVAGEKTPEGVARALRYAEQELGFDARERSAVRDAIIEALSNRDR